MWYGQWIGPGDDGICADGTPKVAVSGNRWPYGPPEKHEDCCGLQDGGAFCDCKASDASDEEWGVVA